jgi:hypothetical protein
MPCETESFMTCGCSIRPARPVHRRGGTRSEQSPASMELSHALGLVTSDPSRMLVQSWNELGSGFPAYSWLCTRFFRGITSRGSPVAGQVGCPPIWRSWGDIFAWHRTEIGKFPRQGETCVEPENVPRQLGRATRLLDGLRCERQAGGGHHVDVATTTTRTNRSKQSAASDHESLYLRRPEYRDRLVAVLLAQGAGLHYLDRRNGVKDLDVWSFFALPDGETRFPEDKRSLHVDFGASDLGRQRYDFSKARSAREVALWTKWHSEHLGRRVDLMTRGLLCAPEADPAEAVRAWLDLGIRRPSSSPGHLRLKGVVFIDPGLRRGEVIWDPRR